MNRLMSAVLLLACLSGLTLWVSDHQQEHAYVQSDAHSPAKHDCGGVIHPEARGNALDANWLWLVVPVSMGLGGVVTLLLLDRMVQRECSEPRKYEGA